MKNKDIIVNLVFRKPAPEFNSIENVFKAIIPHIEKEYAVRKIYLPYRTTGRKAMQVNREHLKKLDLTGIIHITGHENYLVNTIKLPTILTLHDIGSASTGKALRDRYIRYHWFRRPIEKADIVSVISRFSADEILMSYPKSGQKLKLIPNPVDDSIVFSPKEFNAENPTILFVGTKENKNFDRSIEALQGISCKLMILGQLTEAQKQALYFREICYENMNDLSYSEVLEVYKQSDMLLFPSLYEGFGMPILEAQATGRPVITSNIGAMPHTAGSGALLVDPYSASDITQGVKQILANKKLRADLTEKGLQNIKQYAATTIAQQYITLYKSLINDQ